MAESFFRAVPTGDDGYWLLHWGDAHRIGCVRVHEDVAQRVIRMQSAEPHLDTVNAELQAHKTAMGMLAALVPFGRFDHRQPKAMAELILAEWNALHRQLSDARIMAPAKQRRCALCGRTEDKHDMRHVFKPAPNN